MRKLIAAAALLTATSAAPAHAVIFQFYEGNNCTQKQLGSADAENLKAKGRYSLSWNLKAPGPEISMIVNIFNPISLLLSPDTYNDEIRSVRVLSNWHTVREASNPTFTVYDDPKGGSSDDWAKIYVSDASLIPDEGVCVGSFEKAFNKYGIRLERHPVNGLDGKISHLAVACDAACRNNLTPDPNPPAAVAETPAPPKKQILVPIGSAGDVSRKTTNLPAGTKVAPAKKMAPIGSKVVRRPKP